MSRARMTRKTGAFLTRFWTDEGGAAASEYVIILALIIVGTVIAIAVFLTALEGAMTSATSCLSTTASGC